MRVFAPHPRTATWRLAPLAAAVLIAHAWLLASPLLPATDAAPAPSAPRTLQTRTVTLATAPATASNAVPVQAVRPPAVRQVRTAAPRAQPSSAPASLAPVWADDVPQEATTGPADAGADTPPVAHGDTSTQTPTATPPSETAVASKPDATATPREPTLFAAGGEPQATPSSGAAVPTAEPFAPPPSARLNYEVLIEYRGVRQTLGGALNWQHDGERYSLHMSVALPFLGSRVQNSEGRIGRYGLHPQRFAEKTRSERAAHFDEVGARIRYSANTPDAPLLPGHQDRLSVFLQLAGLVHARPERFPAGHTVHMPTSGVRDSETWVFEIQGTETVALPRGDVQALHLRRLPRKEFDTTVDVWLAPSLGHLPVRMRLLEANGNVADQRLITP